MSRLDQTPYAIDPYDCGCTECILRDYVPLRDATDEQIAQMLTGELRNNTSTEFRISAEWSLSDGFRPGAATVSSVQVTAEIWGGLTLTWDLTDHLDGPLGRLFDPDATDDR
ncbi:hypothetical protein ABT093_19805 [Kitasatospora sp. NPDC002551]|uniref:hypothetical protein n=1 Tax=Kitasatospora sp. NPDC002551 TaxID=3154539 RepID=UPI003316944D